MTLVPATRVVPTQPTLEWWLSRSFLSEVTNTAEPRGIESLHSIPWLKDRREDEKDPSSNPTSSASFNIVAFFRSYICCEEIAGIWIGVAINWRLVAHRITSSKVHPSTTKLRTYLAWLSLLPTSDGRKILTESAVLIVPI